MWPKTCPGRGLESPIVDVLNTRIAQLPKHGRDIISIAQAVPGFPSPAALEEAATTALSSTGVNQYTADAGVPAVREALAKWLAHVGQGQLNASSELIVTAGANQAFLLAALTILQAGDAAILAAPFFFNHEVALQAA
jgi:aspartate/methionine/tyrosine aminotransferase